MNNEYILRKCTEILLTLGLCTSAFANQGNAMSSISSDVGKLYVHGSLIESACNIEMASLDQSINLGVVETANLKHIGDRATPTSFEIKLENCRLTETNILDFKTGLTTWSATQPGMKIRFLAESDALNPGVIHANGAKGLGLEITDSFGNFISIGSLSRPFLLSTSQNILIYNITPVKTAPLEPNTFDAIISFEILYE